MDLLFIEQYHSSEHDRMTVEYKHDPEKSKELREAMNGGVNASCMSMLVRKDRPRRLDRALSFNGYQTQGQGRPHPAHLDCTWASPGCTLGELLELLDRRAALVRSHW